MDLAEQLEQRDQLLLIGLGYAVGDDHKDIQVGVARGGAAAQGAEVEHPKHLGVGLDRALEVAEREWRRE